jgi:hypothetical protein
MWANESYKNPLFLKVNFRHQSAGIASDIKNNPAFF